MPRALISVSDKTGLTDFARELSTLGWELVSTGGTAKALREAKLPVLEAGDVTGVAEMLDGRVKTLHPAIHGGILARRDIPAHMESISAAGITPIDMVVVNLYPFAATAARTGASREEVIEQIDIGGPSMLRSAAKNADSVAVVVDPADYPRVLAALKGEGDAAALRRELAGKVFAHTAGYDAAIAQWFSRAAGELFPEHLSSSLQRQQQLRYGENPGQRAAFYVEQPGAGLAALRQCGGKELSFNNLLDLEGALYATDAFTSETCCAIVKHTTPCGIATGESSLDAYRKALACDPVSAFGSVIAFTTPVDEETAAAVSSLFVECLVSPSFSEAAVEILARKKNLRLLEGTATWAADALDSKRVRGGVLLQERAPTAADPTQWTVVTKRQPSEEERRELFFAWKVVGAVKSNAIVLVKGGATIGIGAGQMSRVDASFLAVHKAGVAGHATEGSALGSDAFFPFRDSIDQVAQAGIRAIVQPGGSVRDEEVIAAADEHGIAMVFTGQRQFRH